MLAEDFRYRKGQGAPRSMSEQFAQFLWCHRLSVWIAVMSTITAVLAVRDHLP